MKTLTLLTPLTFLISNFAFGAMVADCKVTQVVSKIYLDQQRPTTVTLPDDQWVIHAIESGYISTGMPLTVLLNPGAYFVQFGPSQQFSKSTGGAVTYKDDGRKFIEIQFEPVHSESRALPHFSLTWDYTNHGTSSDGSNASLTFTPKSPKYLTDPSQWGLRLESMAVAKLFCK